MPILGVFAGKVFQVDAQKAYTFSDLQYRSELQTEKQEAEGKKPSTYNKGPGLDSMSFKIKLDKALGVDPKTEWEAWQNIMNAGIAYPFILGNKPLGSHHWLVVNVSPSNFVIDHQGNILSMELTLQFDEYVRPGTKKTVKSPSKSAPGLRNNNIYEALEKEIFDFQDKSSLKRKNPRMIQHQR